MVRPAYPAGSERAAVFASVSMALPWMRRFLRDSLGNKEGNSP
jgi:hypothetical protein